MAKRKSNKKANKMSTADAMKILAIESKQQKEGQALLAEHVQRLDILLKDYIGLFERYIEHTEDGDAFIEKMKVLIEEKTNEQQANEQPDGEDTEGDNENEEVGAEGGRAKEG